MKKLILLLLTVAMIFGLTCCKKELDPIDPLPKKMSNLKVSNTFSWNTTKDYIFTISGPANRLVKITSADGTVYQKGMVLPNESFRVKLNLPSHIKTVHILYLDQNIEYYLSGSTIDFNFK